MANPSSAIGVAKRPVKSSKTAKPARRLFGREIREGGIPVETTFCPTDVADPFDTVEWDLRTAAIKGEGGEVLFEQTNCEVPSFWTQLATNVVVSKYFYGENGTAERENSVRQLIHRVTRTIADWGMQDGYFASEEDGERFYRDLTWLCLHQHGAFNSPVWFNVGLHHQYGVKGAQCNWCWNAEAEQIEQPENPYEYPQGSACFIQSVQDNMEDIMELARSEAMLFKFGSGTGTDLSTLRSHREKLSGGGRPSGPLSFMRVYDQIAAVVKSGGKTRRAAKMQSIKDWHPDVMEFIECKAKEEKKARLLIEKGGYDANFNGEAYSSILFQNANLSVRLSDAFMDAVVADKDWTTHWVTDPTRNGPTFKARDVLAKMAEGAWQCGDPGVQYDTTINRWHTCPNSGRINASNPCVTYETLVSTRRGPQMIGWLVGSTPEVVGSDQKLHEVAGVFPTGRRRVFQLRTEGGYSVKLTADHKVLTVNRGDVPASSLEKGDKLCLGRVYFGPDHIEAQASYELGKELGAGENRVLDVLERLVGRRAHQLGRDAGAVSTIEGQSDLLLSLDGESFAAVLRGFFDQQDRLVERILFSPFKAAVLQHHSIELLEQFQLMLLGFGIKSLLVRDNEAVLHRLAICDPYLDKFYDVIDNQALDYPDDWMGTDSFLGLDDLGEEDVYDLTEPNTEHFVANGLVVHNCSEYMFLDDTACNLASINLMKFRLEDGTFDVERFQAACRLFFIAQEILVDHASYPTKRIAENSHRFRPLGLGYSNLGSLIMSAGLAYDSDGARGLCGAMTALLHGAANLTSAELAAAVGTFEGYDENSEPMLHVMQMHRDAVEEIDDACPAYLKDAARQTWDEVLAAGKQFGYRNAQATVLAPTGTISFLMDCDTTGIEPDIALVKYKQLAGGGMLKIVNQTVPLALQTLGYDQPDIESILAYIDKNDTIEGATNLQLEHLPIFDCAFQPRGGVRSIAWQAHVKMMAAAQPFLSGAISKTVNMPRDTTPADIANAYLEGWKLGLKALAVYRDGSKESQPLSTSTEGDKAAAKTVAAPRRERLPDTRQSVTHKFNVAGHEGYITVGLFPDGRPGELFITMAKEGSTIGGLMDCFGTAVSMSWQYGVPLEVYVNKFSHTRFEPMGHTKNPDIRIAKSIVDYIFRWLGITFLPGYREANMGLHPEESPKPSGDDAETARKPVARKDGGQKPEPGPAAKTVTASTATPAPAPPVANGTHKPAPTNRLLDLVLKPTPDQNGGFTSRADQFASFQADAPSCDNCGAITVRNGNCYLCHNCGNSMGCS